MDEVVAQQLVEELESERKDVYAQWEALRIRMVHLGSAIASLRSLLPEAASAEPSPDDADSPPADGQPKAAPRGAWAVLAVLKETGEEMSVRQIWSALEQRKWAPKSDRPDVVTATNAQRAADRFPSEVARRREGRGYLYRYIVPMAEDGQSANGSMGVPAYELSVDSPPQGREEGTWPPHFDVAATPEELARSVGGVMIK